MMPPSRFCVMVVLFFGLHTSALAEPAGKPHEMWQARSAEAGLRIYPDTLAPIGVELRFDGVKVPDGSGLRFSDGGAGRLSFAAPNGNFEGFLEGKVLLNGKLSFHHRNVQVEVDGLALAVNPSQPQQLQVNDRGGARLFTASHVHVYTELETQQLLIDRMDVRLSAELAERLGVPGGAGQFIGELALKADLQIPAGAKTAIQGGICADRPRWSSDGHTLDVLLTDISQVSDRGQLVENNIDMEILTPSARLKNSSDLSAADVPWFQKFSGNYPPHNNDQHPYLVWNFYRIADGRFEQIGVSGAKHAFFTINQSCVINCGNGGIPGANGQILWPGCEDVYGVGTNDSNADLGPRDEINPRTGEFVSLGSFFDQDSNGNQDSGSSELGENRMKVARSDLQTANAAYLFEAWYVIRDDSNIFNSMGYHATAPSGSGAVWQYSLGPFIQGPAVDEWVAPGGNVRTGAMNKLYSAPDIGHFKVLARVQALPGDRWRYSYVVMNYDVDHGIDEFAVEVDAVVDTPYFHDPDHDAANDWSLATAGELRFDAPGGNALTWGQAYSFGFDSNDPPMARMVRVGFGAGGPADVSLELLGPDAGEGIFADRFSGAQ
jgi:hypothetical protein